MSYGLGMVIGPYIGGFLGTHYGERFASGASIAGCIVAMTIVWMYVPNTTKRTTKVDTVEQGEWIVILTPMCVLLEDWDQYTMFTRFCQEDQNMCHMYHDIHGVMMHGTTC